MQFEPTNGMHLALLAVVGAVASGINAVAGGGSLVSFPALVAMGIPPLPANATNAVGLWPGSLGSALGFSNQFAATRGFMSKLLGPTIVGSVVGAMLLVTTPERAFNVVVPILILFATVLLAYQPRVKQWSESRKHESHPWLGASLQFLVSIYGGYFGAGMGIMMLAAYTLFMPGNIHELNAIKTWLGMLINLTATCIFLAQGLVRFEPAAALIVGSVIGGYTAARWSQSAASDVLRRWIVAYGFLMVAWFLWRAFA